MSNKVVVVTGSTSGIGLGIAKRFAKDQNLIIINGFGDEKMIEEEKKTLISLGAEETLFFPADMSKPQEINQMFESIKDNFGRIDILINNAGIQHVSPIEDFPPEKWESILRIDLISSFYTIRNTIPLMKKNKWGRIINMASAHGIVASPFKSAYVAAKHGLIGLTKTVALEVAELGITVNAICPGYVKTPLVLGQIADTAKARSMSEDEVMRNIILGAQVTKEFVEIEEIAELAAFLASDIAKSITGSVYSIDGGWTAH